MILFYYKIKEKFMVLSLKPEPYIWSLFQSNLWDRLLTKNQQDEGEKNILQHIKPMVVYKYDK